ncbi:MAG: DUF2061 domain-containing protein [Lentisphaerota bacterium]
MAEKHYRSILKAISWRTVGTLDTMLISFLITGNFTWAISIGAVELFTKMFLYYMHERIWNKIKLGRLKPEEIEYQI